MPYHIVHGQWRCPKTTLRTNKRLSTDRQIKATSTDPPHKRKGTQLAKCASNWRSTFRVRNKRTTYFSCQATGRRLMTTASRNLTSSCVEIKNIARTSCTKYRKTLLPRNDLSLVQWQMLTRPKTRQNLSRGILAPGRVIKISVDCRCVWRCSRSCTCGKVAQVITHTSLIDYLSRRNSIEDAVLLFLKPLSVYCNSLTIKLYLNENNKFKVQNCLFFLP